MLLSSSSLIRHVAMSLIQHHYSVEKNGRALQPVSPKVIVAQWRAINDLMKASSGKQTGSSKQLGENGVEDTIEVNSFQKIEISEVARGMREKKNKQKGGNFTRSMISQHIQVGHASPTQWWMSRFTAPDIEVSKTSSRCAHSLKQNTFKEKLLEARLEGQRSHSKPSKSSLKVDPTVVICFLMKNSLVL
ncbi:unnamed protein product [Camellia sinensis]